MPVNSLCHRVDFDLSGVLVLEYLVQVDENVCRLLLSTFLDSKSPGKFKSRGHAQTLFEINGSRNDGTRISRSNFLDVHTSLVGHDKNNALSDTVIEHSNIVLVGGITTLSKHNLSCSQRHRITHKECTNSIANSAS